MYPNTWDLGGRLTSEAPFINNTHPLAWCSSSPGKWSARVYKKNTNIGVIRPMIDVSSKPLIDKIGQRVLTPPYRKILLVITKGIVNVIIFLNTYF